MFYVFNTLWNHSGIITDPSCLTFRVVPGGSKFGFMEFVEGSEPILKFDYERLATYSSAFLHSPLPFLRLFSLLAKDFDTFLTTAAGSYVGAFLLGPFTLLDYDLLSCSGIRDRHEDNLMCKDKTIFFQLDFKHAYNNKTFGIDSCRFAVSGRFKKVCFLSLFSPLTNS